MDLLIRRLEVGQNQSCKEALVMMLYIVEQLFSLLIRMYQNQVSMAQMLTLMAMV